MKIVCTTANVKETECAVEEYLRTKNMSYKIVPVMGGMQYDIMSVSAPVVEKLVLTHLQTLCEHCKARNAHYREEMAQKKMQKAK